MASAGVAYVDIMANWGPFEAQTAKLPGGVSKTLQSAGKTMTKYFTVPILAIGAASADLAAKFDRSMLLIHTSAGASSKEVKALGKYIEALGTKAPQSLNELAAAAYRIEGGGIHGAKAMKALKEATDFSVLQDTNVEETAKSISQVAFAEMEGAGKNFEKIVAGLNATIGAGDLRGSNLIDALGTGLPAAAKQAGLSFQEMDAALAVIGDNTTNVSGGAAQLATAFHYLYDPTEKAVGALEEMGLKQTSLAADLKKPDGLYRALADLKEHLEGLPGGERGVKSTQLLGEILPGGRGRILLTFINELGRLKEKEEDIGRTSSPGRFKKSVEEAYEQPAVKAEIAWNNLKTSMTKFGQAILPAVIPAMEKIGEKAAAVGEWFAKLAPSTQQTIVKVGLMVAALGPVLVVAGKIYSVFSKIAGVLKAMRDWGLNFSRQTETEIKAVQPVVTAEAASARAAAAAPVAPVVGVPTQSSFLGPGTGAAQTAAAEAAAIHDAEEYTSYLGIPDIEKGLSSQFAAEGSAGSRAFLKNFASEVRRGAPALASSAAVMGARFASGLATWGIGGVLVGQMTKELTHSQIGTEIGTALQTAGVGAAIGTAIAPGIGTAIGAALGGAGGFVVSAIEGHEDGWRKAGEEEGARFLAGYEKHLPQIEKMVKRGFIGTPSHTENVAEVPGSGIHIQNTTGGTGLRGQRGRLEAQLNHPQSSENKAKIEAEIQAIDKAIRSIQVDRATFKGVLKQMSGDALDGIAQINKDLHSGLSTADSAWGRGTKAWHEHAVEAMKGAVSAIEGGMEAGVISTNAGQKRINALLRKIKLTSGNDPAGIAEGLADSFKEAGKVTSSGTKDLIKDLAAMPKGARIKGIESIEGLTEAWAEGHPKLEKQVDLLTQNIRNKFGGAGKAAEEGQRKSLQHIIEANTGASASVASALTNIGSNLDAALKALGAHSLPEFKIVQEANAFHHRQQGGPIPGTFIVPGTGSGDKVPMLLPAGSFIENREAAKQPLAFQAGGLTPVVLEPGERGWLPNAVARAGLGNLEARNARFSRFQIGGLAKPTVSGTGPLATIARNAVGDTYKEAAAYLRAHSEPERILRALHATELLASKGFPYKYGGGHGSFGIQPVDCSGLVSYSLHAAGFIDSPMSVQQGSGLYTLGVAGPGKFLTWGVRGTSGENAHTMDAIKAPGGKWKFFESGGAGGRGAHEDSGWDGSFQFRHMPGYQSGGIVGMPKKAQEAVAKFGQEAFDPKSKHFVGWGFQRGGAVRLMRGGPAGLKLHGPAVFTQEGPEDFSRALKLHAPWSKPGPWQTALTKTEEGEFRAWLGRSGTQFNPNASKVEYDMRGFWQTMKQRGKLPSGVLGFYPDAWKTPYDAGWSKWSKYARRDAPFDWIFEDVGEGVLVNLNTGRIILDHRHAPNKFGEFSRDRHVGLQRGGLVGALRLSSGGSVPSRKGELVGASTYGGPADHVSNPTYGAAGPSHPLAAQLSFAELAMGKALGGLKFGTPLKISRAGRSIIAYKEDIGLGGGDVSGHNRAIDLWYNAAEALGVVSPSTPAWLGTVEVASVDGTKGLNAKEEKEHTYKEEVPAEYKGCAAKKTIHFPSIPKSRDALEREIAHWVAELAKYDRAIKDAKRANRPAVAQDLQHNRADIAHHLRELRNAKRQLRREEAKKKFTRVLRRKFSKVTGMETAIEAAQQVYEKRGQYAEQVVDLEPTQPEVVQQPGESDDAFEKRQKASEEAFVKSLTGYVEGQERPAYQGVLESEATWRDAILEAEAAVAGNWSKQNFLGGFEGNTEKGIVAAVQRAQGIEELAERVAAEVAAWRKQNAASPHPAPDLPKALQHALELRKTELARLPFVKFKEKELRGVLGEARELFYPGKAGGGIDGAQKIYELLTDPQVPARGSGSFEDALKEVQGIHWPDQHEFLKALPAVRVAGSFGGAIWDTQTAIAELGLKVQQAINSGTGSGSTPETDSELLEIEKELRIKAEERLAADETLRNTIAGFAVSYPPYAGKAHTGAVVPGPSTEEKTMIVKGGEAIFTEEQTAALGGLARDTGSSGGAPTVIIRGDIVSSHPEPVAVDWGDPTVRREVRTIIKGGRMVGQGRGSRGPR